MPLATPCLLVDLDRLEANVRAMASLAGRRGLALRPHAKTHKCVEIARLQRDAGAAGLTVATVGEAEVFAEAGFDDLFIGYPIWASPAIGERLRRLTETARLRIGIDSPEGARALAAQLGPVRDRVGVLVEVDSGQHRSGVAPVEAGLLGSEAQHTGLDVLGAFTFPGHSYSPATRRTAADDEAHALTAARASLQEQGIRADVLSGGSTPSASATHADALTEMRPGVYVFGDAQQWELDTTKPSDIALTCLATVVSHAGGNVVLDSGSKALGADRATWASGYGRLLDHPDARLVQLSEHHAVVDGLRGPLPQLGSTLRVVPNHACNAVNLADTLTVVRDGALVGTWRVAARGANR